MFGRFLVTIATSWIGAAALGAVITTVDLIDPSDGIGMPPTGQVAIDVLMDLTTPGDEWTAGGIVADALNGASFVYRAGPNGMANLRNPNAGNPTGNRTIWATSVSNANARNNDDGRFSTADCAIAGGYSPPSLPAPLTFVGVFNVAWFRTPDGTTDIEGAVARIVINLPPDVSAEQVRLSIGTVEPPGTALLRSIGPATPTGHDPGTVNASVMFPEVTGIDWVVWIPEPASFWFLVFAAVAIFRAGAAR